MTTKTEAFTKALETSIFIFLLFLGFSFVHILIESLRGMTEWGELSFLLMVVMDLILTLELIFYLALTIFLLGRRIVRPKEVMAKSILSYAVYILFLYITGYLVDEYIMEGTTSLIVIILSFIACYAILDLVTYLKTKKLTITNN